MKEKIIELLQTGEAHNIELATQVAKGQDLYEQILDKYRSTYHFLYSINKIGDVLDFNAVSEMLCMTELDCSNMGLESLDVSNLTALKYLYCYDNKLTTLDVSKLTALEYLYCYNNKLSTLVLPKDFDGYLEMDNKSVINYN